MSDLMARYRGGGVRVYYTKAGIPRYRATLHTDNRSIPLGTYDTEEEAQAAIAAAHDRLGTHLELPSETRLSHYGIRWLDRRETSGRVRGIVQERSVWRTWIATAPFADFPLGAITRGHVVRWVRWLEHEARSAKTGRRLSRQTVKHALATLRRCLAAALDEERIESNPAADVALAQQEREAAWTWLTEAEIARVLDPGNGAPEVDRLAWTVLIYTGLRRGELAALSWRDVHLGDKPHIMVRASMRPDAPTKSGAVRRVPLLPPALAALRRQRQRLLGASVVDLHLRDRPVFPSSTGGYQSRHWRCGWRTYVQGHRRQPDPETGEVPRILDRDVRLHDLRHTCGSHLIQGTWGRALALHEVREWLGHSSIEMTERYAHLAPEGLDGIAEQMAAGWDDDSEGADVVPIGGEDG